MCYLLSQGKISRSPNTAGMGQQSVLFNGLCIVNKDAVSKNSPIGCQKGFSVDMVPVHGPLKQESAVKCHEYQ